VSISSTQFLHPIFSAAFSTSLSPTISGVNYTRCQFHQCSTSSFYALRSQKHKKRQMAWQYFFVRPCVRRKFPKFSFSRVWEKFDFRSSEIFRKKMEFLNSRNFRKKVRKKILKFKFGKKFRYYWNCRTISKILKKLCKVWVFWSINPVFGSKSLVKVRKKFGKVWKFWKQGFPNVQKIRKFWKLFFSKISEKKDVQLELRK